MVRFSSKRLAFAVFLGTLAGFIDSIGFISFGGLFFSFMSGNTTKMGAHFGSHSWSAGLACLGVIGLFITGVIWGTLVGRKFPARGRSAVLGLVAVLLILCAGTYWMTHYEGWLGLSALAMGAINTSFDQELEGNFGFTFVTGALVRAGQRIAWALSGEPNWTWAPYLLLWSGLAIGALVGAMLAGLSVEVRLLIGAAWGLLSLLLSILVGDRCVRSRPAA